MSTLTQWSMAAPVDNESEPLDIPDTLTTKFMKYFPTGMFLLMSLAAVGCTLLYGPQKIMDVIAMVVGEEVTFAEVLKCTLLICMSNILCMPSSFFDWGLLPTILGDLLGTIISFFLGRLASLPEPSLDNPTLLAVNRAMNIHPFQFAMLIRISPLPAALKNYGSGAMRMAWLPFVACALLVSPISMTVFCLLAVSARDFVDTMEVETTIIDEFGNEITVMQPLVHPRAAQSGGSLPLWGKLTALVVVGTITLFLATNVLKKVHREFLKVLDETQQMARQVAAGEVDPQVGLYSPVRGPVLTNGKLMPSYAESDKQQMEAALLHSPKPAGSERTGYSGYSHGVPNENVSFHLPVPSIPTLRLLDDAFAGVSRTAEMLTSPTGRCMPAPGSHFASHMYTSSAPAALLIHGHQQASSSAYQIPPATSAGSQQQHTILINNADARTEEGDFEPIIEEPPSTPRVHVPSRFFHHLGTTAAAMSALRSPRQSGAGSPVASPVHKPMHSFNNLLTPAKFVKKL